MAWARAGIALVVAALAAGIALSGGTPVDPPAPSGFPGVVPAFLTGGPRAASAGAGAGGRYGTRRAAGRDRLWLARARHLGRGAPPWARAMYRRSLLVLRALVDRDGGAVAGARPGWAYVWPRDAGAVAIALASAGYRREARRIARFLLDLELGAAARFDRAGAPIEGRGAQGDAAGWVTAAARAAGVSVSSGVARPVATKTGGSIWRDRSDYQEGDSGEYLGNAIASAFAGSPRQKERRKRTGEIARLFVTARGLVRSADDPESGLDSAAAWAVRPFALPRLYPAVRRTLLRLVAERQSRFGLLPSEDWNGGDDPWTAPTAWCAWSLASLWRIERQGGHGGRAAVDRSAALRLLADLRRAATPLGLLPERVDVRTGMPASTTPLAWSHAFAILALRAMWRSPRPSR